MMQNKFKILRDRTSRIPAYSVKQMVDLPIWIFDLNYEVDSNEILSEALKFKTENNNKPDLVIGGNQTIYYNKNHDSAIFKNLCSIIEEKAELISKRKYMVLEFWFVFYDQGASHKRHSHRFKDDEYDFYPLSAAYYPVCTNNKQPIVFENENSEISIPIRKNRLILFNSQLYHRVDACSNNGMRIAFSCNLISKGN